MTDTSSPFPTTEHTVILCDGATAWWVVVRPKLEGHEDTFFPYLSDAREFAKKLGDEHGWSVVNQATSGRARRSQPSFLHLLDPSKPAPSSSPRKKPRA